MAGDGAVVTLEEYRALLADARAMVVALCAADVTSRPVAVGNPPLDDRDIEVFDRWRRQAVTNWNLIGAYLRAADPDRLRAGLYILHGDLGYPLTDVRSDWQELAPQWSVALTTFVDHLRRLEYKTAVYDRPAAGDEVAAFLPTLASEFRSLPANIWGHLQGPG